MDIKCCSKCKIFKSLNEYPKDKSRKDGYSYRCSVCKNAEIYKYFKKNKEFIYQKNKGKHNEYFKKRYKNKTEEQKQNFREYLKIWNNQPKNKEKRNKYQREVYRKNPQVQILIHLRKRINDFIKGVTKKQKYLDLKRLSI
jgi:hypothetical protein